VSRGESKVFERAADENARSVDAFGQRLLAIDEGDFQSVTGQEPCALKPSQAGTDHDRVV
jgi:hypothetical protein